MINQVEEEDFQGNLDDISREDVNYINGSSNQNKYQAPNLKRIKPKMADKSSNKTPFNYSNSNGVINNQKPGQIIVNNTGK